MAKKKKSQKSGIHHFVFNTRKGFYTLVLVASSMLLLTMNLYGAANFESSVLGENDEVEKHEEEKEERHEEEKKREDEKREEKQKEEEKRRIEAQKKIELKHDVKPEKIKIEYKAETATSKLERKIEFKDGQYELEEEFEQELGDDMEKSFEEEHEAEIASDSSSVSITKNKIKARTGFPLTIDGATNQLLVTRPDGSVKAVSVLPDQAVENFMRHKKVNLINFEDSNPGTPSGNTDNNVGSGSAENQTESQTKISLVNYKDQLAYEIKGKKKLSVLGIIPVNVDTTGYVSAETGDVIAQEEPFLTQLLNLLSP